MANSSTEMIALFLTISICLLWTLDKWLIADETSSMKNFLYNIALILCGITATLYNVGKVILLWLF